jgi:hypothetical protein
MKIKLPKDIVGVKFPRISTIDMNDFDIDLFLPSLFFTILSQGRGKARQTNDPKAIAKFVDTLANHSDLTGFNDVDGRKVLERLVRTTLITTGGVGRSRIDEQITSIVPYTILAHKPGFPVQGSRQRSADTFIYQVLREYLGAEDALRSFVKMVFGRGVIIGSIAELGGIYDGETKLDTLTRLSIAFLDGFENTRPGSRSRGNNIPGPCPGLSKELATDLLRYLFEYHTTMPTQAFTHHLLVLINFELFNYTLKLVNAVNELVQHSDSLPTAMRESAEISPPQLFLDFTESSIGYSQEMAKACVRRDIETYQQFLSSNLLLRQLDMYVENLKRNPRYKSTIEDVLRPGISGAEYLQGLLWLINDPAISLNIDAAASFDEDRIRRENTTEENDEDPESLRWLDAIVGTSDSSIERVVSLLVESQKGNAIEHFVRWYWGVGGMKKPQGVLRGTTLSRKSWRYAPTNDLLAVFVQLAAVRLSPPTNQDQVNQELQPIRLQDFCGSWRCVLAYWLIDHRRHLRVQNISLRRVKIFEPCYVACARWGSSAIFQTTLRFNACILPMQLKRRCRRRFKL